jgi:hypothetical protein
MWKALETPLSAPAGHAMWAGREIMMDIPEANRLFDPEDVPQENATMYPAPGDICWGFFPGKIEYGVKEDVWDIAIVYGRETRFDLGSGPVALNLWAVIDQNLDEFAREGERIWTEGAKQIRIERRAE